MKLSVDLAYSHTKGVQRTTRDDYPSQSRVHGASILRAVDANAVATGSSRVLVEMPGLDSVLNLVLRLLDVLCSPGKHPQMSVSVPL